VGNEILAEELLTTATVVAVSTQLGVVCHDAISNLETVNFFAKCCNFTYSLMARDKRELRFVVSNIKNEDCGLAHLSSKFAIVDMQVCTTHPRGLHFNLCKVLDVISSRVLLVPHQNLVLTKFWKGLLYDAELSSLAILYSLVPYFSPMLSNNRLSGNTTNLALASKGEDQKDLCYPCWTRRRLYKFVTCECEKCLSRTNIQKSNFSEI